MMLRRSNLLICCLFACIACSSTPDLLDGEPQAEPLSIAKLQSLRGQRIKQLSGDISIKGRVVSTDLYFAIYKELYIQDETGGVVLALDGDELFASYLRGQEVTVKCNSLYVSPVGSECRLGFIDDIYDVALIPAERISTFVTVSDPEQHFAPQSVTIATLAQRHLGCLVEIMGVQFVDDQIGMSWCEGDITTRRTIEDASGNTIDVRTNNRAQFANSPLPSGSGYVRGLVVEAGGRFELRVCATEDVALILPRF